MATKKKDIRFDDCCFTSFRIDEIDWWQDWTQVKKQAKNHKETSIVSYIVIQGELTESGRKHIQGYVQFSSRVRMTTVQDFFGDSGMHIEKRKGTEEQARFYCTKDYGPKHGFFHDSMEFGIMKKYPGKGARTDLIGLRDKIKDNQSVKSIIHNTEDNAELTSLLKYKAAFIEYERDVYSEQVKLLALEDYKNVEWKPWQKEIVDMLELPYDKIDKRKVIWIFDEIGNTGKSWIAKYIKITKGCYIITGGKQADILYGYNNQPVVIYDLARTYSDNLNHIYTTIENFKNGMYLNTKFESRERIFKIPIVIVMANFLPDTKMLSKDRWDIWRV